jgi:16S rRNA processing protein RimM
MHDVAPGNVAVARVLGAWGVGGHIKVEPLAPPSALTVGQRVRIRGSEHRIEQARREARFTCLKLSDIDDREHAASLRGAYLEVPEEELELLPDGHYYRFQLVGLGVRSTDGQELGRITEVLSTPANDVFVVGGPHGEILVPAADDIVRDIDLEAGIMTIEVVEGLIQ